MPTRMDLVIASSFRSYVLLTVFALGLASCARESSAATPDAARGRYLVESVAMCQDCHSPRDDQGQFLADRWMMGSPLAFQAIAPMPWAPIAPPIAGLPTLPEDEPALRFLTTGELPGGRKLLPPMPQYRFSAADAAHVLAYLRGLAPSKR
jgi:mono/diheme cytochrome c family protein